MENTLQTITEQLDRLLKQRSSVILAIEGHCTAGKTTLSDRLKEHYDCNVLHMDDFFLRPEQRTTQRYAECGGNVDYERFAQEVLLPLKSGSAFSYRPFDCGSFTLAAPVEVLPKKLTIIEGTYCLHPYFGDYADLKIFLSVAPETQRARILRRPAFLHDRFFREWIPMEHHYFEGFGIREKCDLVL